MATAVAVLLLLSAPVGPAASKQNAAADRVVEFSRGLGIDFDEKNQKSEHPDPADVAAFTRAGFGAWLDAQITNDSDEIAAPPAALQEFLHDRRDAVWNVVSALEKNAPEWDATVDQEGMNPRLLPTIRLAKMILALALVEERGKNRIDGGRALEASWSLGRSLASDSNLLSQILSVAIEKLQAGVLRKVKDAPLQWQSRLATDGPWNRMLEAVAHEGRYGDKLSGVEAAMFEEVAAKAFVALSDALRKVGPCELSTMSDDDIWKPAAQVLSAETSAEKREIRDMYGQIALPGLANPLRRAARVEVDRELTLKLLQLRLEKESSRDRRWPAELTESWSMVCPGVAYAYRADRDGVDIRFEGSVDTPSSGPVLPLEFRSGKARIVVSKPTPAPEPTPTPEAP